MMNIEKLCKGDVVYISGPIRGRDLDEAKEAFKCRQKWLASQGYVAINPFENGLKDDDPIEMHMRNDILMLMGSDAIYLMQGWEKSEGCRLEMHAATLCGLAVVYEEYDEL